MQQRHQRHRGQHLSQLADDAGELGQHRHSAHWEPGGDQPEHRDERQRVAGPAEYPRHDGQRQHGGQRQQELSRCHYRRPIAMRAREPKRSNSSPTGTCNPA